MDLDSGDKVVGMSLRPNYHITVGLDCTKPTEIAVGFDTETFIHRWGRRASPCYQPHSALHLRLFPLQLCLCQHETFCFFGVGKIKGIQTE